MKIIIAIIIAITIFALIKSAIKANKANAFAAVIVGPDELANGEVTVKNLDSGEQKTVALNNIEKEIN